MSGVQLGNGQCHGGAQLGNERAVPWWGTVPGRPRARAVCGGQELLLSSTVWEGKPLVEQQEGLSCWPAGRSWLCLPMAILPHPGSSGSGVSLPVAHCASVPTPSLLTTLCSVFLHLVLCFPGVEAFCPPCCHACQPYCYLQNWPWERYPVRQSCANVTKQGNKPVKVTSI